MKNYLLTRILITGFIGGAAVQAVAANAVDMSPKIEKWAGTGAAYTPDGQLLESYKVEVVSTITGPVIQSDATVTLADGTQRSSSQTITTNGYKWSLVSTLGKGGGACYGPDVCENLVSDGNGREFATTMFIDGKFARHNVTFQLDDGKAVRVMRDRTFRVQ